MLIQPKTYAQLVEENARLSARLAECEDAVRFGEERLQLVARATNDAVYDWDLRTGLVWSNRVYLERYGSHPADVTSDMRDWLERVHPDEREQVKRSLDDAVNSDAETWTTECHFRRPDGSYGYVLDRMVIVRDAQGEAVRMIGSMLDLTERRQVEDALRASEQKFSEAFGLSPVMFSITSLADGRLLDVNQSLLDMTGFTREEVLGRTPVELGLWVHPEERERGLAVLRQQGRMMNHESVFRMKNGEERTCLVSVEIIQIGGEPCVLTALVDITARKRSEERLRLLAELGEKMRRTEDPDELLFAAARTVGEHLQIKRAFFIEMDLLNNWAKVRRQYCDGVQPVASGYHISDYSNATLGDMLAGRTVINCDSQTDPRTAAIYETVYRPNGERAYVAVPLLREERWVATLWLSDDSPREWSAEEVALLQTVAERAWLAVENARLFKETEAALRQVRESEERFRALANSAPSVVWTAAPDGAITFVNDEWLRYTGLSPEQNTRNWPSLVLHPDDYERCVTRWTHALQTGWDYEIEVRNRRHDGEYRWFLTRAVPMRDAEGRITAWYGTTTDIHDRKQAEEELRRTAALLRGVSETTSDLIFVKDRAGRLLLANPAMLQVIGQPAEVVLGKNEAEWHHDKEQAVQLMETDRRVMESGQTEVVEETFTGPDGTRLYLSTKSPLRDERGEVIGLVGVSHDLTNRKRNEEAVRQNEERYRSLFNSMDEGFCIVEVMFDEDNKPLDYRFLEINPMFEKHTGLIGAEGKTARELVPDLEPHWFEIYGKVALTGEPVRFTDGSNVMNRWFDVYAFRVGQPEERKVAILFNNITDRRRAEEALRRSETRQSFLLKLGDALRPLAEPVAIQAEAARVLGEHLGVNRAFYADAEADGKHVVIRQDYYDGVPSAAGRYRMDDFGAALAEAFRAGRTLVVDDVAAEVGLTDEERAASAAIAVRAHATVCLVKGGRLVGLLGVRQAEPRAWTTDEVALVEDAAERTWAAVERARAEEALRENEERFRDLADNISQFTWMADEKGWIFWYNQRWYDYTGTTLEEMQGWGWRKVHHPDHVDRVVERIQRSWDTGEVWEDTFPLRGKDGQYRWFLSRARPIRDGAGRIVRWFGTNTDVTEQLEIEAALSESEARFRLLADSVPTLIWLNDAENQAEFMNAQYVKFLGRPMDELLGGGWTESLHPEDAAAYYNSFVAAAGRRERFEADFRFRRADGEYRWMRTVGVPRFEGGVYKGYVGSTSDIHERKREEQDARFLADLGALFNRVSDPEELIGAATRATGEHLGVSRCVLHEIDLDGGAAFIERDYCRGLPSLAGTRHTLSSFSAEDMADYAAGRIVVRYDTKTEPRSAERYERSYAPLGVRALVGVPLLRGGRWVAVCWISSHETRQWTDAEVALLHTVAERVWLAVENARLNMETHALNTTLEARVAHRTEELRQSQAQLRRLSAYAERTRENERGRIAREVHDQLGGSLTVMKMSLARMRKGRDSDTQLMAALQDMVGQVDTTVQTVRRIASDLRPPLLDDLGLLAALEWQAREFQQRTGIACQLELPQQDWNLDSEIRTAMFRVFQESLTNVARHAQATQVIATVHQDGDGIILRVQDNGRGISADILQNGKSFGLLGMRERIREVAGDFEITGVTGGGTTVTIRVPLAGDTSPNRLNLRVNNQVNNTRV